MVAFALVLFFAGVSSKLATRASQYLAICLGATLFVGATVVLFILPKISPF